MLRGALHLLCAGLLLGCVAAPLPAPSSPAPLQVAADVDAFVDRPVRWGGMIVDTRSFAHHTEIELIAFPLDRRGEPVPHARDLGRFIVLESGFLDPAIHAPGRFLLVDGRITGDRRGELRGVDYVWPEVDADRVELLPADFRARRPRVSVSVGIGFGR